MGASPFLRSCADGSHMSCSQRRCCREPCFELLQGCGTQQHRHGARTDSEHERKWLTFDRGKGHFRPGIPGRCLERPGTTGLLDDCQGEGCGLGGTGSAGRGGNISICHDGNDIRAQWRGSSHDAAAASQGTANQDGANQQQEQYATHTNCERPTPPRNEAAKQQARKEEDGCQR